MELRVSGRSKQMNQKDTDNTKTQETLVSTVQRRIRLAESLFGIAPETVTEEEAKEERLNSI